MQNCSAVTSPTPTKAGKSWNGLRDTSRMTVSDRDRAKKAQIASRLRAGIPPLADETLNKIVQLLVDTFSPERIYLFGSRARGESTADSDYDFLMVVTEAVEPRYRLAQRAHSLLWDLAVAADILVWTAQDFDSRLHLRASLPSTVIREGRLLYAA